MKLAGTVAGRLRDLIDPELYAEVSGAVVAVEEHDKQGRAIVRFRLPPDATNCVQWQFEHHNDNRFRFLLGSAEALSAADGAFSFERAGGGYELHVIELKRKVTADSWIKAKSQMRWSLIRLLAFAGLLDIPWRRIVCYTGFSSDTLSPKLSPDVVLNKMLLLGGGPTPHEAREVDATVRHQLDWLEATITVAGLFESPIAHVKVAIGSDGEAAVDLGLRSD